MQGTSLATVIVGFFIGQFYFPAKMYSNLKLRYTNQNASFTLFIVTLLPLQAINVCLKGERTTFFYEYGTAKG